MLVEMSRTFVVGLKKDFRPILDSVQKYGKVHLGDMTSEIVDGGVTIASSDISLVPETTDEIFTELARKCDAVVLGLEDQLGGIAPEVSPVKGNNPYALMPHEDLSQFAGAYLDGVVPEAAKLAEKMEELSAQAAELERFGPILEKIGPLVNEMVTPETKDSIALMFEKRYAALIPDLNLTLKELTDGKATVVSTPIPDDDNLLALVLIQDKRQDRKIRQYLVDEGLTRVSLPSDLAELSFADAIVVALKQYHDMPGILEAAKEQIAEFYTDHISKITWLKELLSTEDSESIEVKYGESAYTFVIEGYLPSRDLQEFQDYMSREWGDKIKVDVVGLKPSDYPKVPVQLENEGKTRFFQAALGIWGQPMYGTFDPTIILRYSFPLVFGLIVGDVGYGLLLYLICLFASLKNKDNQAVQTFTGVLKPAGLMAIAFGVFYWEFFGDLAHVYIPGLNQVHPYMFNDYFGIPFMRTLPNLQTVYLFMAIGFGFVQVCFGLVLGMINAKKLGQDKHIWEKIGILTVLVACVLFAVIAFVPALTAGLPGVVGSVITYIIYAAIAFGVIALLWGGGIMGAIETLEAVSNIASYIRIMAVGLAGALLADAANQLAFKIMPGPGGVAIALVLHVVNFAIICFSPSIHALRLNFLEFFGKFWKGGTVSYKPFTRKEGQS